MLSILVFPNQLTNVLAAGAVSAFSDLAIDKCFERIWQRNIHRGHEQSLAVLAKFDKKPVSSNHYLRYLPLLGLLAAVQWTYDKKHA